MYNLIKVEYLETLFFKFIKYLLDKKIIKKNGLNFVINCLEYKLISFKAKK